MGEYRDNFDPSPEKPVKCMHCGSRDVYWDEIKDGETTKWRLFNTKDRSLHRCRHGVNKHLPFYPKTFEEAFESIDGYITDVSEFREDQWVAGYAQGLRVARVLFENLQRNLKAKGGDE